MKEIVDRADVELLVNRFYDKVRVDELLGPVFANIHWPEHLPTMYNFWSSMLLGDQSYRNSPFAKHVALNIGAMHFERWLQLFSETVDENFKGERAEEVKARAHSIAAVWQHKLSIGH